MEVKDRLLSHEMYATILLDQKTVLYNTLTNVVVMIKAHLNKLDGKSLEPLLLDQHWLFRNHNIWDADWIL